MPRISIRLDVGEEQDLKSLTEQGYTKRAIFTTAIRLTEKLVAKGKELVSKRRDKSYLISNPLPIGLSQDTVTRLGKLNKELGYRNQSDALSYCLRSLIAYTKKKGNDILDNYEPEPKDRTVYLHRRVRIREDLLVKMYLKAEKLGIKIDDVLEQVMIKGLSDVDSLDIISYKTKTDEDDEE